MKSYEIDMCHGPLLRRMLTFTIPLACSSILQLLFNAADIVVVGRFSGEKALAAVGSTTTLINLLLNLVIGISIGAGVVIARNIGAKDEENISKGIHTAIAVSLAAGTLMMIVGELLAGPLLQLMGTPADVIDLAERYIHIYFIGLPMAMLYNFGASVLRATGDTRRPLFFLIAAGIMNVAFNLVLVIGLGLSVAGVAIATVVSQVVSALLVLRTLMHMPGALHVELRRVRIYQNSLKQMLQIGLPAGVQGILFNVSNVLIQSSINSFGSVVVAGNTAAVTVEGFIYASTNASFQTSLNFTSQNRGAGQYKRIDRILLLAACIAFATGSILGLAANGFSSTLIGWCTTNQEAISYGLLRLSIVAVCYGLCGVMDVIVGSLRGLGYSVLPTVVCLLGACLFRIVWIFTVFQRQRSLIILYLSYPISWVLTVAVLLVCYLVVRRHVFYREQSITD